MEEGIDTGAHEHTQLKVTPWRDWFEWRAVAGALFGDDPARTHHALRRVSVWEHRGRVPVPVSATAQLLALRVAPLPHEQWLLAMSMALVRLVNGLVAPYHGAVAAPVAQVAAKLALPQQLVELRHAASHHGALPSVELLEEGAELALAWLREHYWQEQERALSSDPHAESIAILVEAFRQMMKDYTSASDKKGGAAQWSKAEFVEQRKQHIDAVIKAVTAHTQLLDQVLLPHLLDHDCLVPTKLSKLSKVRAVPERLKGMWMHFLKRCQAAWPNFYSLMIAHISKRVAGLDEKYAYDTPRRRYLASILVAWARIVFERVDAKKITLRASLILPHIAVKVDKWTAKILKGIHSRIDHSAEAEAVARITRTLALLKETQQIKKVTQSRSPMRLQRRRSGRRLPKTSDDEDEEDDDSKDSSDGESLSNDLSASADFVAMDDDSNKPSKGNKKRSRQALNEANVDAEEDLDEAVAAAEAWFEERSSKRRRLNAEESKANGDEQSNDEASEGQVDIEEEQIVAQGKESDLPTKITLWQGPLPKIGAFLGIPSRPHQLSLVLDRLLLPPASSSSSSVSSLLPLENDSMMMELDPSYQLSELHNAYEVSEPEVEHKMSDEERAKLSREIAALVKVFPK